ncbi:hypothetical protein GOV05_00305 [Candidatus Woesearchaeota archaeon]|nr:hypothetical protein [Candidatus Woesearchaeota archaeon]
MKPILLSSTLFFQLMISVTLIAVLRNIVGIRSFGVFGPTIITFGILKTGLFLGLTMYLNLFLIAMALSFILYKYNISSSYRVAIIISSIVVAITFFEVVGELYHIKIFEAMIFFPVLITSWLADRFVVQVKEVDWVETSKKLVGTIIIIILVYFVITISPLINFVSVNPETWIGLVILNFYLANKTGFRVSDYLRFKNLLDNKKDILSLNVRNREYIAKYNPPNLYPNLSKDKMKLSFHQLNIPTPKTYAIIETKNDIGLLDKIVFEKESFVIKPTKGLGGEGILVIDSKGKNPNKKLFVTEKEVSLETLKSHIKQILEGQYANSNEDKAIIEEKIEVSQYFQKSFGKGVFDIRVIVFYGFPVMAMMRIPTKESKGFGNIHKGAISVGLDITTGKAINPFWKAGGGEIKYHPDTKKDLTKIKIPNWDEILRLSCLAQGASKLNYAGVDVVLSKKGPLVLEVNKRPGIEIQNANLEGLLKRLRYIENNLGLLRFEDVDKRVSLSKKFNEKKWE